MTPSPDRPPTVFDDPAVPAHDLLGDGAPALLGAALAAVGAEVEAHQPVQSNYQPGRSLRVCHDVTVRWADGTRTQETMGLSAGRKAPAGAFVVSDGTHDVAVWRVPHDPWLPGLPAVAEPARAISLLTELGVGADLDPADLSCRVLAYRPGRRAVVEISGPTVRVFVKVTRPKAVRALRDRHEMLAGALPTPAVLGWSEPHGIVVLQALPGRLLRDALFHDLALPSPATLVQVLDQLPPIEVPEDRPVVDWRAEDFAGLIGSVAPDLADRVVAIAHGLAPFEAVADDEPVVAVHGDYYEAQLLVDGGTVCGLLDVDTYGPGRRVDDLATMIGHLSVLALGSPHRTRIERYAARLLERFDREVDPALLRAAVAGVVLGLATGSFRVLDDGWERHTEQRVALAEAWLDSAQHPQVTRNSGTQPT